MSSFAPSASAAREALKAKGVSAPIVELVHPGGKKGAKFSLDEVAKRAWAGRNDPRIRAWTIRNLKEAGEPTTKKGKAAAILKALKKATMYVPDPTRAEVIQRPDWTLCLDEFGLCFKGGDCFPAGTRLLRSDGTYVDIDDVLPGDLIAGLDTFVKVQAVAYKGVLEITQFGLTNGAIVSLTPDHHVTVLRCLQHERCDCATKTRLRAKIRVRDLQPGDVLPVPSFDVYPSFHAQRHRPPLLRVQWIEPRAGKVPCFDIQTEDGFVYLPEHDVTVNQCDDLTVAMLAAFMSIDLNARVVAHAYDDKGIPTHVLCAVETENGFEIVDPSLPHPEVGKATPHVQQWTFDPYDTRGAPIDGNELAGDFVGVGRPEGPRVALLGMGDNFIDRWLDGVEREIIVTTFAKDLAQLEQSAEALGLSLQNVEQTRQTVNPAAPYDPEPNGQTVTDLSQFPDTGSGIWTQGMSTVAADLYLTLRTLVHSGRQAMNGERSLLVLKDKNEIYVEAKPGDPWHLHAPTHSATDTLLVFYDEKGNVLSGVWGASGKAMTAAEVNAALSGSTTPAGQTGTGAIPVALLYAGAAVLIAAIAGVTVWQIMDRQATKAETLAVEATNQAVVNCVTSGKCTAEEGQRILQENHRAAIQFKQAQAELAKVSPLGQLTSGATQVVQWLVIGGLVAGVVILGKPIVERFAAKDRAAGR